MNHPQIKIQWKHVFFLDFMQKRSPHNRRKFSSVSILHFYTLIHVIIIIFTLIHVIIENYYSECIYKKGIIKKFIQIQRNPNVLGYPSGMSLYVEWMDLLKIYE